MSLAPPARRPQNRRMLALEAIRQQHISPGFAVVTQTGDGIRELPLAGPDRAVRLFFPREGQDRLLAPTLHHNGGWPNS